METIGKNFSEDEKLVQTISTTQKEIRLNSAFVVKRNIEKTTIRCYRLASPGEKNSRKQEHMNTGVIS